VLRKPETVDAVSNIATDVRAYVIDNFLFGDEDDFVNDTSFLEQGIIDSTGVLELVAYLESNHNIKVEDNELLPSNLDSIDLICAFIQRKQATSPSA
jgi:acyl carrier protein